MKPIIVVQFSRPISRHQFNQTLEVMQPMAEKNGWQVLVIDAFGSEDKIQVFGLDDKQLPEFIELKKLVYDNIKGI